MTDPLFYVERLEPDADQILVAGPEGRHAVTVRRLRVGEAVRVSDGAGSFVSGVVHSTGKDELIVSVTRAEFIPAPKPRFVVVQALPKGERAELAVATLTEVGVDEIVPWAAEHCVTRWDPSRSAKGLARWRLVAHEAGKQSRRPRLPAVADLASTAQVVQRLASAALPVVLHEAAASSISELSLPTDGDVVIVVGPEGGISPVELAAFEAAGVSPVRLGPEVLRTSTAGAVGASVLLARSGRWSVANTI